MWTKTITPLTPLYKESSTQSNIDTLSPLFILLASIQAVSFTAGRRYEEEEEEEEDRHDKPAAPIHIQLFYMQLKLDF